MTQCGAAAIAREAESAQQNTAPFAAEVALMRGHLGQSHQKLVNTKANEEERGKENDSADSCIAIESCSAKHECKM